jgi:hypothetical protein
MTPYHEFVVPLNDGGAIRAWVSEPSWERALYRLKTDDPAWRSPHVTYVGVRQFDEQRYRCRPRTRPFVATYEQ